MSSNTIDLEATAAVSVLLEGFDAPPSAFIESKIRQAYLLDRVDQASHNFDDLLTEFKRQASEKS